MYFLASTFCVISYAAARVAYGHPRLRAILLQEPEIYKDDEIKSERTTDSDRRLLAISAHNGSQAVRSPDILKKELCLGED